MSLTIGDVRIGDEPGFFGAPCKFIAELSGNHNGDYARAIRLIDAAKAIGVDIVKFQAFTVAELLALRGDGPAPEPWASQGHTMSTLYELNQTPLEWLPPLFQYCRDIGLAAFSSVFGMDSLAALERSACPAYKIARLDNAQHTLVSTVVARGKPVLISVDHSDRFGVELSGDGMHVLYCPKNYPTAVEDVALPQFQWRMGKSFSYIGLSSHCMDPLVPLLAVARGCAVIEMHLQLDDEPSARESAISLTTTQFAEMITNVRKVEAMLA